MRTCVCYLEIQRSHGKEGNESFAKEGHSRFVSVAFGFHCGRWKVRYMASFLCYIHSDIQYFDSSQNLLIGI